MRRLWKATARELFSLESIYQAVALSPVCLTGHMVMHRLFDIMPFSDEGVSNLAIGATGAYIYLCRRIAAANLNAATL